MKRLVRWLGVVSLLIGCLGLFGWSYPAVAAGLILQPTQVLAAETPPESPETLPEEAVETAPEASSRGNNLNELNAGRAGKRIDLNNANVRAFSKYPGMYPTLARIIVGNAPYEDVNDVLNIQGLSNRQLETLQANLDKFTVSNADEFMIEGQDRYNNGIYK